MENRKEFNKITRIRYDKKMIRFASIVFVVSVLITIACKIFAFNYMFGDYSSKTDIQEIIRASRLEMLVGKIGYIGQWVLFISGIIVFDGEAYFRKLKKLGYTIPTDRNQYQCDLQNLPRETLTEGIIIKPIRSKVLFVYGMVVFILCLIQDILLYFKWEFMDNQLETLLFQIIVFDLGWLLFSFFFWRQQNQQKYKEVYEIDPYRKNRLTLVMAVVITIVLSFFTLGVKLVSNVYMGVVYRSCREDDRRHLDEIGTVLWNIYMYRTKDPTLEESNKRIYEVFEQGFIITDFDEPQNAYLEEVANCLEIESFDELSECIHISDGDAKIHIILKGDTLIVTLMNPAGKDKKFGVQANVDTKYLEERQEEYERIW